MTMSNHDPLIRRLLHGTDKERTRRQIEARKAQLEQQRRIGAAIVRPSLESELVTIGEQSDSEADEQ